MRQKDSPAHRWSARAPGWDAYMTPCMAQEDLWI